LVERRKIELDRLTDHTVSFLILEKFTTVVCF